MKKDRLLSDQLYTWSDIHEESIYHIAAQKKKDSCPPTTICRGRSARISDRTLQEMRKTGLSVRRRARAWPQILSFGKPNGEKPSDGLHPSGLLRASRNLPGELSSNQRSPERNLRYQLRTSPAQREAVGHAHGFWHCCKHRYRRGRHTGRQYDHRTAKGSLARGF